MPGVARKSLDSAGGHLLASGASSVKVDGLEVAVETSTNGIAVVQTASTTVFAENKGVAREADAMSNGTVITSGSTTVFAG